MSTSGGRKGAIHGRFDSSLRSDAIWQIIQQPIYKSMLQSIIENELRIRTEMRKVEQVNEMHLSDMVRIADVAAEFFIQEFERNKLNIQMHRSKITFWQGAEIWLYAHDPISKKSYSFGYVRCESVLTDIGGADVYMYQKSEFCLKDYTCRNVVSRYGEDYTAMYNGNKKVLQEMIANYYETRDGSIPVTRVK